MGRREVIYASVDAVTEAKKEIGVDAHYRQLKEGQYLGEHVLTNKNETVTIYETSSISIEARGTLPAGMTAIAIAGSCVDGGIQMNGLAFRPNEIVIFRQGAEFDFVSQGKCALSQLFLPTRLVTQLFEQNYERQITTLSRDILVRSSFESSNRLFKSIAETRFHENAEIIDEGLDETLSLLSLAVESGSNLKPTTVSLQRRVTIVRKAKEWICAHLDTHLPIAELCRYCCTSERTLERSFQLINGCSPRQYILAVRLHRVSKLLKVCDPHEATVSELAMVSGFRHMGRFSRQYKSFFGEFPKQTLGFKKTTPRTAGVDRSTLFAAN